ncbi:MAG: ATP-dependent Clp protease proteolytic subunit, partial [Clostridia bacterium]|nr:ATP-dependent Clp protease proteolytic subunit [Clostridia bacterium]
MCQENERTLSPIKILPLFGQIEGHTALPEGVKSTRYEEILPLLAACEQDEECRGLLLLINSVGGDVEAGLAIAEMLAGMHTPTVSLILGGGHSIGLPLAVSASRSFVVPSATLTL